MTTPTKPVDIKGGLNLVTPPMKRRGGGLQAVQNYRNDQDGGITRIGGYERFDGQAGPSEAVYWCIPFDCGSIEPEVNQDIVGGLSGTTAVVLSVVVDSGDWSTCDAAGNIYAVSVNGTFLNNEAINAASNGGFSNGFSSGFELGITANDCGHDFAGAGLNLEVWESNSLTSDPTVQPSGPPLIGTYSPNAAFFAAGDSAGADHISLYDVTDWSVISDPSTVPTTALTSVVFSRDSSWLASFNDPAETGAGMTIWDTSNWSLVKQDDILTVTSVKADFNLDKSVIAAIGTKLGAGPAVELINTSTWAVTSPATQPATSALSVNYNLAGTRLSVGYGSSPYIMIYETTGYTTVSGPVSPPDDGVVWLEYSPDGTQLAAVTAGGGGSGDTLFVYNTSDWSRVSVTQPGTPALSVAWSTDGSRLLVATNDTQKLYMYDTGDWSAVTIDQPLAVIIEVDFEP